jgi:hypothetical protein
MPAKPTRQWKVPEPSAPTTEQAAVLADLTDFTPACESGNLSLILHWQTGSREKQRIRMMVIVVQLMIVLTALVLGFVLGRIWEIRWEVRQAQSRRRHPAWARKSRIPASAG